MGADGRAADGDRDRLFAALEHLLALEATEVKSALEGAAQRIAEMLGADKVDVFLLDRSGGALVAVGTSDTRMGRRQRALGLDRLPLDDGGRAVEVYRTGKSYLIGRADRDPVELPEIVDRLGVRATVAAPLEIAGERRGVLMTSSAAPHFFSERDLRFVEAVARWVGLVGYRAAHVERLAARAAEEGYRAAAEGLVGALSPRQQEVAELIAGGLTNAEIAERLVLTRGTVTNHVEHILRRLGLRSRTEVAVWVAGGGARPPRRRPDRVSGPEKCPFRRRPVGAGTRVGVRRSERDDRQPGQ